MRLSKFKHLLAGFIMVCAWSCKQKPDKKAVPQIFVYKGLYSLGPGDKTFKECATGHEYWVTDSTAQLELKYWEIIPHETPDSPVYIEVEGDVSDADLKDNGGQSGSYEQTLVVKKINKITKDIPAAMCK